MHKQKNHIIPTFCRLTALVCLIASCAPMPESLSTPTEPLLKQQQIHRHSCGPCSLVHSFAHASPQWRNNALFQIPLNQQANHVIAHFGKKTSAASATKKRWNPRKGMNAADLHTTAQELSRHKLEQLTTNSPTKLENYHAKLNNSLTLGFPPIISLKQQVHKKFNSRPGYYWIKTKGHFITLIALGALAEDNTSFPITYIDSFDGRQHTGTLQLTSESFLTTSPLTRKKITWKPTHLQAKLPQLQIANAPQGSKITTEIDSITLAP